MQEVADQRTVPAFHAAVSLCYPVTLALPLGRLLNNLDRYAMHGTFYAYPAVAVERAKLLRSAVIAGHELGNGALTGLADDAGLLLFDEPGLIGEEFEETERFLRDVLRSPGPRSFCYPLPRPVEVLAGEALAAMSQRHNGALVEPVARRRFRLGRGAGGGRNDGASLDPLALRTLLIPESDPAEAIPLLEQAAEASGSWTLLSFQCGRNQVRAPLIEAHERVCDLLSRLRHRVRVGSVVEIGSALLDDELTLTR